MSADEKGMKAALHRSLILVRESRRMGELPSDAPALIARGIRKTYGEVNALEELSFSALPGEIIGLLGPNGAGKTTAIRVLTTILPPGDGSFEVGGVPGHEGERVRARIGVLPESAGYPEHQNGIEYLSYHGELFGLARAESRRRAAALLEQIGLSGVADSPIGDYSRGMRQRLGIVRALVNDPMVVFLDEPTLGLDPAGQRQILAVIASIAADRGATVVLSTHFLAEVEEVCSRVLILNNGRLVADGSVAEVTRRAAAARRATLRVPPERASEAMDELDAMPAVRAAHDLEDHSGAVSATFDGSLSALEVTRLLADAVGSLARAGIPTLSVELERARLSEVFLKMTGGRS
jgi:ABC-2 type transport system ATP-binding protein